jgi:hypothetical protein
MAFDAFAGAFCQFMFHQRGEEPRGRPAFFVGLLGKLRPKRLYGGQA